MLLDGGALVFNVRDFISFVSWELQYWNSPHSTTGSIALGISMNDSESSQSNERRFFKINLLQKKDSLFCLEPHLLSVSALRRKFRNKCLLVTSHEPAFPKRVWYSAIQHIGIYRQPQFVCEQIMSQSLGCISLKNH